MSFLPRPAFLYNYKEVSKTAKKPILTGFYANWVGQKSAKTLLFMRFFRLLSYYTIFLHSPDDTSSFHIYLSPYFTNYAVSICKARRFILANLLLVSQTTDLNSQLKAHRGYIEINPVFRYWRGVFCAWRLKNTLISAVDEKFIISAISASLRCVVRK